MRSSISSKGKIAEKMEPNNRIEQFHKDKITEKAVAVMAFFKEKILEMFMAANFMLLNRKKGESKEKEQK